MKRLPLVLSSLLLISCSGSSANENVQAFHDAQKAESEKGNVGYRLEGHATIERSLPNAKKKLTRFSAVGIKADFQLERAPEKLFEINYDYLAQLNANLNELSCTSLDVEDYPDTEYETKVSLRNPSMQGAMYQNVGYFDFSGVSMAGAKVNGAPVQENVGRKWKVNPVLTGDPFGFKVDETIFDTYVISLFDFSKQGNHYKATLDLPYSKISDLYTGIKLAMWLGETGYDALRMTDEQKQEMARQRNFYQLQVGSILSEDFRFTLSAEYQKQGFSNLAVTCKGEIYPNGLTEDDDNKIEAFNIDVNLTLRSHGNGKFKKLANLEQYQSIRHE